MKLKRPILLVNKVKCKRNIAVMANKAKEHSLIFRPHFKTHQSVEVAELFLEHGVEAIAVSSVTMAEKFASTGWNDITIAFSVNVNELEEINHLAQSNSINILVENIEAFSFIRKEINNNIGVFIKIDAGYNRTGVDYKSISLVDDIISVCAENTLLKFKGFVVHSGNTYQAKSPDEILEIHTTTVSVLNELKSRYIKKYPDIIVSLGDTPSCSIANNFSGIDEIRPGNFVYYDVMQYSFGSCRLDDIAVCVACPVVAIHAHRNKIVVYGGAVHLSKEYIEVDGDKIYGLPVKLSPNGWDIMPEGNFMKGLSQEHGIIHLQTEEIEKIMIGDFIGILPVHSCLTANLMKDKLLFVSEFSLSINSVYSKNN
ncbi:MAG: alanine racemase [Bacteroidota bacterium]|nr:alanine racemase [Bacteroidota bacterium]